MALFIMVVVVFVAVALLTVVVMMALPLVMLVARLVFFMVSVAMGAFVAIGFVVVMVLVVVLILLNVIRRVGKRLHPACGKANLFKIKATRVHHLVKRNVALYRLDNLCLGRKGGKHAAYGALLLLGYPIRFIEYDFVAKFYLGNEQLFNRLVLILPQKAFAAGKFVHHAEGVYHTNYVIYTGYGREVILLARFFYHGKRLHDGKGLANAACLY
jgi:hypothetical protein